MFVIDVLAVFAEADEHDALWWRTDGDYSPVTFFVNCNDLFYWATADCEKITEENLPLLKQTIRDCQEITGELGWAPQEAFDLFCCRVRGMRPQQPAYPKDERFRPLFDAAGPMRSRESEG